MWLESCATARERPLLFNLFLVDLQRLPAYFYWWLNTINATALVLSAIIWLAFSTRVTGILWHILLRLTSVQGDSTLSFWGLWQGRWCSLFPLCFCCMLGLKLKSRLLAFSHRTLWHASWVPCFISFVWEPKFVIFYVPIIREFKRWIFNSVRKFIDVLFKPWCENVKLFHYLRNTSLHIKFVLTLKVIFQGEFRENRLALYKLFIVSHSANHIKNNVLSLWFFQLLQAIFIIKSTTWRSRVHRWQRKFMRRGQCALERNVL